MGSEEEVTMNNAGLLEAPDRYQEFVFALVAASSLAIVYSAGVGIAGGKPVALIALPLLAVLIASTMSFAWSTLFLIVSLFVNAHVSAFSSAVWFAFVFGVSFLLDREGIRWRDLTHPLSTPLLIYGLCILPSLLKTTVLWTSLFSLLNIAAFLIVMYATAAGFRSLKTVRTATGIFLVMVLLNSIDVLRLSLAGDNRPFGFAGIMFVDFVALGLCIAATIVVVTRGRSRFIFLVLLFFIAVGLVLTQTRNTWLSAIITLVVLACYLIVHPEIVGYTRKRLLFITLVGSLALTVGILTAVYLNPRVQSRAVDLVDPSKFVVSDAGVGGNSLISRLFIWVTAYNAFRENPVFGVGIYSFPHSSHRYYAFPRTFYNLYVKGNSPHQTHLAVLAETGIIGFAGFLVFLGSALTCAFRGIRNATSAKGKHFALVAAIATVYCAVSMAFSDAWLFGQGIVLFGIVLGSMLSIRRINSSAVVGAPSHHMS
ncbi:MAG TPA: hypothetical protein DCX46_07265 [Bacteroidetes bacterium]|nr:hypothetical protein [Bacteroidota bacterium]